MVLLLFVCIFSTLARTGRLSKNNNNAALGPRFCLFNVLFSAIDDVNSPSKFWPKKNERLMSHKVTQKQQ